MAISEVFAHQQSTSLSLQATPGTGVTDVTILDLFMFASNLGPRRVGVAFIVVDGNAYTIDFTLSEENIDQRTIQGYAKQENPDTAET